MRTNVDKLSVQGLRDSRAAWWSEEFNHFLSSAVEHALPGRLLDVGCGIGTFEHHFAPRSPSGTAIVGTDIDTERLAVAAGQTLVLGSGVSISYVTADGRLLPFADETFKVALVILTLQHVVRADTVLSEMRRVTQPGGVVAAVEADNLAQRLYFPFPAADVDAALAAFWVRIGNRSQPANIAIGPRLPELFRMAGLPSPELKTHMVARVSWIDPKTFADRARASFEQIARSHGIEGTVEREALCAAIGRIGSSDHEAFYTISTVPLFLVTGRVPAA